MRSSLRYAEPIPADIDLEEDDTAWAERCEHWLGESRKEHRRRALRERPKQPLVLCGNGVLLRVDGGALTIRNGFTHYPQKQETYRFFKGELTVPPRIIMLDGSGSISFEVLGWLSEQKVSLIRIESSGSTLRWRKARHRRRSLMIGSSMSQMARAWSCSGQGMVARREVGTISFVATHPKRGITSHDAISPDLIGEFFAKCKAEKILIILDTCYSGDGARQIVSVLEGILATRLSAPGQQRAFAIIASAHPLEQAQEAVFLRALRAALFESQLPPDKRIWTDKDEFITADDLAVVATHLMPPGVSSPQCKASGLGQRFIPNPRYRAGLPAENVEERLWRLMRSDASEHFDLAARGIEVGEKGWFFSGRKRLLHKLVDWLRTAENGVRIVTGPPGAGKSAVIGRLATLSDSDYRQDAIEAGVVTEGKDDLPCVGAIDIAIHAKGKTRADWLDCDKYLWRHLADHAAKADGLDLDNLIRDSGYLAVADPARLVLALTRIKTADGHRFADIYDRVVDRLTGLRPVDRMPLIHMTAQNGGS